MNKRTCQIKDVLEKLYAKYSHRRFIKSDPLQFLYQYSNRKDMEIAAFLAADLAYGRVGQIEKSLTDLLGRMGDSPYEFVLNFDSKKRSSLKNFKHRFTTGEDISDLLMLLKTVLRQYGSIEKFFVRGYDPNDKNIIPALSRFCDSLLDIYAETHNAGPAPRGLRYLLVNPSAGSACKRLNLFLRWMVRNDRVDAGLWRSIDKAKLVVPIDVHMGRLSKILGLYEGKTASLASAIKITDSFAEIDSADPVKYDFALTRIGILEDCTGKHNSECEFCELFSFCNGN